MADKDLTVRLKADDQITPTARKAADSLEDLERKGDVTVDVQAPGLDDLTDKLGSLPGALGDVGGALGALGGAGAAAGIGAIAAGMFAAASAAKDLALEAKTTADLTGSTVEEASKLQNLWGRTGADVNDLNDVLLQMNGALAQSPELASQLGINLNDGKNITQRFVELTDKLAAGQLNAQQASALFGEEGVRQVGKLRTVFGGLSDDLEGMPAPVDDEDVAQALEMERAIGQLKAQFSQVVGIVGKDLVPLFTELTNLANNLSASLPGGSAQAADLAGTFRDWGTGLGVIEKGAGALNRVLGDQDEITASVATNLSGAAVATGDAAAATTDYTAAGRDATEAMQAEVDATLAGIDAMTAMADARRASADSAIAARNAERDFADQITKATEAMQAEDATMQDVAQAMDDTASAAADVADAQVRVAVDTAAASGETLTAAQQQSTFNQSMLASARTAEGPLRDSIIAYIAQVNNIPPEKVSEILADPDNASIAAADRALNEAARDRQSKIVLGISYPKNYNPVTGTVSTSSYAVGVGATTTAGMAPMVATPAATMAPIVVNVPRPTPTITINAAVVGNRFDVEQTVARALVRYERRNGTRR